jgi:hypothetical protein
MERSLAAPPVDDQPGQGHEGQGRQVGGVTGRHITIDGLLDRLDLVGLRLDPASVEVAAGIGERARRIFGGVELLGRAVGGRQTLHLLRPDGRLAPLPPPAGPSVHDTARAMLDRCWSGRWGPAEEQASELLAHGFLTDAGPCFSVGAAALCEWFLFDGELTTGIDPARRDRLLAGQGWTGWRPGQARPGEGADPP